MMSLVYRYATRYIYNIVTIPIEVLPSKKKPITLMGPCSIYIIEVHFKCEADMNVHFRKIMNNINEKDSCYALNKILKKKILGRR